MYGKNPCCAALLNTQRIIQEVLITEEALSYLHHHKNIYDRLQQNYKGCTALKTSNQIAALLGPNAAHQGIALKCKVLLPPTLKKLMATMPDQATLAVLDQATDPQNLGAIIRSAAAFNIRAVLITQHHSCKEGPAVAKAASGALEVVPLITIGNLQQTLKYLKECGFWICGLDISSAPTPLSNLSKFDRLGLVLGNEGKGLRALTKKQCDLFTTIPYNSSAVESLNLSNAAALAFSARFNCL